MAVKVTVPSVMKTTTPIRVLQMIPLTTTPPTMSLMDHSEAFSPLRSAMLRVLTFAAPSKNRDGTYEISMTSIAREIDGRWPNNTSTPLSFNSTAHATNNTTTSIPRCSSPLPSRVKLRSGSVDAISGVNTFPSSTASASSSGSDTKQMSSKGDGSGSKTLSSSLSSQMTVDDAFKAVGASETHISRRWKPWTHATSTKQIQGEGMLDRWLIKHSKGIAMFMCDVHGHGIDCNDVTLRAWNLTHVLQFVQKDSKKVASSTIYQHRSFWYSNKLYRIIDYNAVGEYGRTLVWLVHDRASTSICIQGIYHDEPLN